MGECGRRNIGWQAVHRTQAGKKGGCRSLRSSRNVFRGSSTLVAASGRGPVDPDASGEGSGPRAPGATRPACRMKPGVQRQRIAQHAPAEEPHGVWYLRRPRLVGGPGRGAHAQEPRGLPVGMPICACQAASSEASKGNCSRAIIRRCAVSIARSPSSPSQVTDAPCSPTAPCAVFDDGKLLRVPDTLKHGHPHVGSSSAGQDRDAPPMSDRENGRCFRAGRATR